MYDVIVKRRRESRKRIWHCCERSLCRTPYCL